MLEAAHVPIFGNYRSPATAHSVFSMPISKVQDIRSNKNEPDKGSSLLVRTGLDQVLNCKTDR